MTMNQELSSGLLVLETSIIAVETTYIIYLRKEMTGIKLGFAQELKDLENKYEKRLIFLEDQNKELHKKIEKILMKMKD